MSERLLDDAPDDRCLLPRLGLATFSLLAERLEVRLHSVDLWHRLDDRALDLARERMRLLERELARQLQVQGNLGRATDVEHADVVDLAHAAHDERRRMGALPD